MLGNSLFLSFLLSSALFVSSLMPAALQSSSTVIHKLPDCASLHCNHLGSFLGLPRSTSFMVVFSISCL